MTSTEPQHATDTGYKPVFNDTVRTIVYVLGLVAVAVGSASPSSGTRQWVTTSPPLAA